MEKAGAPQGWGLTGVQGGLMFQGFLCSGGSEAGGLTGTPAWSARSPQREGVQKPKVTAASLPTWP